MNSLKFVSGSLQCVASGQLYSTAPFAQVQTPSTMVTTSMLAPHLPSHHQPVGLLDTVLHLGCNLAEARPSQLSFGKALLGLLPRNCHHTASLQMCLPLLRRQPRTRIVARLVKATRKAAAVA